MRGGYSGSLTAVKIGSCRPYSVSEVVLHRFCHIYASKATEPRISAITQVPRLALIARTMLVHLSHHSSISVSNNTQTHTRLDSAGHRTQPVVFLTCSSSKPRTQFYGPVLYPIVPALCNKNCCSSEWYYATTIHAVVEV